MTPLDPPKPPTELEEQHVILQSTELDAPLKAATLLIALGIQKYYNVLIKL
jgi:hypothetical protein